MDETETKKVADYVAVEALDTRSHCHVNSYGLSFRLILFQLVWFDLISSELIGCNQSEQMN